MIGDKNKYSRSTKKYKGGNNMKELTYDELIKNNGGNNDFAESFGRGFAEGLRAMFEN